MNIDELKQLIADLPRKKWGSQRRKDDKQAIINRELLKMIVQIQEDIKPKPRGRPPKKKETEK